MDFYVANSYENPAVTYDLYGSHASKLRLRNNPGCQAVGVDVFVKSQEDFDPISGEVDLDAGMYSVECADGLQIRVRYENAVC